MNMPATSTVTKSVSNVVDSIPFDAIPQRLSDVDVSDAWSDATDFVADSAAVIGRRGSRIATRTARGAWRNRSTVVTVLVIALAVVGAVSLWQRRRNDDSELD